MRLRIEDLAPGGDVQAEDVVDIYSRLSANGIRVWLSGGWGIDALLGERTRPHKDLDIIMLVDDIVQMRELLSQKGFALKELWPENRWVLEAKGAEVPTAFVLCDDSGRELDAHAMRLDDRGWGVPAWANEGGLVFEKEHLSGEGMIAGSPVRCLSAEMQIIGHTGYDLPEYQVRDMQLLCDRFGTDGARGRALGR